MPVPNRLLIHSILHRPLIIKDCEFFDIDDVRDALEKQVDLIIDSGYCPLEPTTVIDLSLGGVDIIRQGAGDVCLIV